MYSRRSHPGITPGRFPHSDISGSKLARSSPKHFAACHVLLRLLAPRHPPHALCSLTYVSRVQHEAGPREHDVGFFLDEIDASRSSVGKSRPLRARASNEFGAPARSSADRRPRRQASRTAVRGWSVLWGCHDDRGHRLTAARESPRMLSPTVVRGKWWR